jgi:hypothetical protein
MPTVRVTDQDVSSILVTPHSYPAIACSQWTGVRAPNIPGLSLEHMLPHTKMPTAIGAYAVTDPPTIITRVVCQLAVRYGHVAPLTGASSVS